MAARRKSRPQTERRKPLNEVCPYCANKTLPYYRNYQDLEKFVTDRRKILGRSRSGICARHQRVLAREIKRARHLALLPFSGKLS